MTAPLAPPTPPLGPRVEATFRQLTPLVLLGVLVVLIVAQAYLSAAFVPGLSVFHGGLAWLGSTAVASVIPGPIAA